MGPSFPPNSVVKHFFCFFYVLVIGDLLQMCNARKLPLRKTCMHSEMEIFSRHGVRIEPYDRSHIELFLFNYTKKNRYSINMDFKTNEPNGVLFYGRSRRHPGELIALTLQGGNLVYQVKCPTLHADLLIPTYNLTRLDDGRWHRVSYTIKNKPFGRYGLIEIDGFFSAKRYEVTCHGFDSVVIGGHSERDKPEVQELQDLPGHFNGCIRNFKTSSGLQLPPKYYAVSICD